MRIVSSTNRRAVASLLSPQRVRDTATEARVAEIVADVRRNGDRALRRYARDLDDWSGPLEIGTDAMREAAAAIPASVRIAIRTAARNIRTVAKRQVPKGWRVRTAPGVTVEQRIIPLDRGEGPPQGRRSQIAKGLLRGSGSKLGAAAPV